MIKWGVYYLFFYVWVSRTVSLNHEQLVTTVCTIFACATSKIDGESRRHDFPWERPASGDRCGRTSHPLTPAVDRIPLDRRRSGCVHDDQRRTTLQRRRRNADDVLFNVAGADVYKRQSWVFSWFIVYFIYIFHSFIQIDSIPMLNDSPYICLLYTSRCV